MNNGGGASRHSVRIDYEDQRQIEPFRHFGSATFIGFSVEAIVQAHDAFDDRHILFTHSTDKQLLIGLARQHPSIEIVGANAGSDFMEAGIDEVRPNLERLH